MTTHGNMCSKIRRKQVLVKEKMVKVSMHSQGHVHLWPWTLLVQSFIDEEARGNLSSKGSVN